MLGMKDSWRCWGARLLTVTDSRRILRALPHQTTMTAGVQMRHTLAQLPEQLSATLTRFWLYHNEGNQHALRQHAQCSMLSAIAVVAE